MKNLFFAFILSLTPSLCAENKPVELKSHKFKNQHGVEIELDESTKFIVFANGKESSTIVSEALKGTPKDYLKNKSVVYIADVSGMPSLVYSWFALPKMKEYPFSVAIDEEGNYSKILEFQKEKVSLIELNNLKIKKNSFFESPKKLRNSIDSIPNL